MKNSKRDTLSKPVQAALPVTLTGDSSDPGHDAANPLLLTALSGFVSISRTPYSVCLQTGVLRIAEGTGDRRAAREE